jgi:hypothetical protein
VEILLAVMLLTWAVKRTVSDAIVDNNLAKQGIVSPRMERKHGATAAAKVDRYGFTDFLRDAWNDYWPRRADALIAARDAKAANPGEKVRFRDRLAAAKDVVVNGARKVAASPVVRKLVEPVERKPRPEPEPAADEIPDATRYADLEPGTRRNTDDGDEEWDGYAWRPARKQETPAPTAGGTMTTPTGEAVNYETTVAELEALLREQQLHLDACTAAERALGEAKGHIGDMQDSYRSSSAAAASTHEHLAVLNLDADTLGNTGTVADAMPAGAVDTYFDQLEAMEVMAKERRDAAEVALQATEAALAGIVAKYGDAATTVAGDLGGDSRFLAADGGVNAQLGATIAVAEQQAAVAAAGRQPARLGGN